MLATSLTDWLSTVAMWASAFAAWATLLALRRDQQARINGSRSRIKAAGRGAAELSASYPEKWDRGYAALVRFVEREGHANVLKEHVEDGAMLGRWVRNQRRRYGSG
jgi:Helicase associated domain